MKKSIFFLSFFALSLTVQAQLPRTFTVKTATTRKAINEMIYGVNSYVYDTEQTSNTGLNCHGGTAAAQGLKLGSVRLGGNSATSYCWENGICNSGNDYCHANTDFHTWITGSGSPSGAAPAYFPPGLALTKFNNDATLLGAPFTLLQLPGAGYVGRNLVNGTDCLGNVNAPSTCGTTSADPTRWVQVVNDKNAPLSMTPNLSDNVMYVDEEINFMIQTYGKSTAAHGIKAYELDNEPGLWHHYPSNGNNGTHSHLHENLTTCGDVLTRNIGLATTVKRMDVKAKVFGPAMWGYAEFYSLWSVWDGASHQPSDWATYNVEPYLTNNTGDAYRYNHATWANAYLAKMNQASVTAGKRLLDVFSVHYYPADLSSNTVRMQAPRSLWDPTFVENSWITQVGNGFTDGRALQLLPTLNKSITDFYPGTKLAITEYDFGGRHHISGAIAEADALGIFGKNGLYAAQYFGNMDHFVAAGMKLFRNYNGAGGKFGNTSVYSKTTDNVNSSIYAAVNNGDESKLNIIVLNKGTQAITATINVTSPNTYTSATVWGVQGANANILAKTPVNSIVGNSFTYTVPATSAYHFVLSIPMNEMPITSDDRDENTTTAGLSINLSPNPVQDMLMLSATGMTDGLKKITIFDMTGKTTMTTTEMAADGILEKNIAVEALPTGVYLLEIRSETGVKTVKFVKN